jgi:hypothetical protein
MTDGGFFDFGATFFDVTDPLGEISKTTKEIEPDEKIEKRSKLNLKAEKYELSTKYVYRRAFSETRLLDAFAAPGFHFEEGVSYHLLTGGDIDALSYLKAVIRQQRLEHCLISTWCMAADDVLQFREWIEQDHINRLDIYVGEIFTGSYKTEYSMLKRLYGDYPGLGRICVFRNHSKIMAGIGAKFAFGIQTSANINTNPRTEQACITIDRGLYDFYKNYFDGINSFE